MNLAKHDKTASISQRQLHPNEVLAQKRFGAAVADTLQRSYMSQTVVWRESNHISRFCSIDFVILI